MLNNSGRKGFSVEKDGVNMNTIVEKENSI